MCTAVTYRTKDSYFGRNLDLEYSYSESVTVTPRNFPFRFGHVGVLDTHFAMIGMAFVSLGYPLYYEAVNEKGLAMAGLNFPGNAFYGEAREGCDNLAPFELIPWVLGQCRDLGEARLLLERANLVNESFSDELPNSPLHWIVADRDMSLTAEPLREGLRLYDNPVGVLTNNPPFDYHLYNLANYMSLTREEPDCRISDTLELKPYSRGMGAIGLPGDLSSASRFVRAAYTKLNSVSGESERESVSQFFHILGAVGQQRGCARLASGLDEITIYSCCCNVDRGIYYYTTYDNSAVNAVDMNRTDLDSVSLTSYPLVTDTPFNMQN